MSGRCAAGTGIAPRVVVSERGRARPVPEVCGGLSERGRRAPVSTEAPVVRAKSETGMNSRFCEIFVSDALASAICAKVCL